MTRGTVVDSMMDRPAFGELGDREFLRRVDEVDHVVDHALALLWSRLGGADVHPPIDLHRVDGDDLGADGEGDLDGGSGLPGGRGAQDGDDQTGLPTR